MGLMHLIAAILWITLIPACLADTSNDCPPRDLVKPCDCYHWDSSRDDWGNWTRDKNYVICTNVTGNDVLVDVVNKTKDYGYEFFSVTSSKIGYFPASAFEKITRLFLISNTMVSLFNETPNAVHLRELWLNKVVLSQPIRWEYFKGMPKLERLTIMHSRPISIDRKFVQYIPKSLERITINNCSISKLPNKAFQTLTNLKKFSMDDGRIKSLNRDMFPSPAKIEEFSIQSQRFRSLPENIFVNMPNLKFVYLDGNLFAQLPETTFKPVLELESLFVCRLSGNPIKCNCDIRWIVPLDESIRKKLWGECEAPKRLKGKQLSELTQDFYEHCAA